MRARSSLARSHGVNTSHTQHLMHFFCVFGLFCAASALFFIFSHTGCFRSEGHFGALGASFEVFFFLMSTTHHTQHTRAAQSRRCALFFFFWHNVLFLHFFFILPTHLQPCTTHTHATLFARTRAHKVAHPPHIHSRTSHTHTRASHTHTTIIRAHLMYIRGSSSRWRDTGHDSRMLCFFLSWGT